MARNKLTSTERIGASLVGAIAIAAVLLGLIGDRCSSYSRSDSATTPPTIVIETAQVRDSTHVDAFTSETKQKKRKKSGRVKDKNKGNANKDNGRKNAKRKSASKAATLHTRRDYLNEPIDQD